MMKRYSGVGTIVLCWGAMFFLSTASTASSLVGAWTFGNYSDTSGNTLDSSGILPALNGTLLDGATLVKDSTQRGWVLKPNGGGCLLGYDHKLYAPKSITVQYWHKKITASESWKYMVGQDGNGPRHFNNGGGMIFGMSTSDSGWNPISVDGTGNTQWRHFVATYDGEYLYGYINGVQVAKIYRGGTINTQNNYWSIGRQWNGMAAGSWSGDTSTGWIDDVAVWNGYAPAAVVQGLYNGTYTIYNAPIEETNWLGDYPDGDYDRNGYVNLLDFEHLAQAWLADCGVVDCGRIDDNGDDTVNTVELSVLADQWLYDENTGPRMSIENLNGVPTFKVNDEFTTAAVFSHNWPHPNYVPVRGFAERGTIMQDFGGVNISDMWLRTNPDKWNYSNPVDQRIAFLVDPVTGDPDVLLMPWVTTTPPQWWLDDAANVDELEKVDNGSGPTIIHNDGKKYPSLASPKWRQDMAYALENLIDYLYLRGYMNNIAGFKLSDVGCGGENLWHYSWRQTPGGYSDRTRDAFRDWLRVRYNNDVAALRSAWNKPTITFDMVAVPTLSERKAYSGTRTFRDPSIYLNVIDWEIFWNELLVDTMDYFAAVIKNKTNRTKLVGGFYCYMYEWCGNPEDGHQALGKYNRSQNLDFVWQTASYETRLYITGGDVLRGPGYSNVLHGKQWANSNDTATYLATGVLDRAAEFGYTNTVERNKRMFLRSAGFNICNVGYLQEFFALHDDWYNDPALVNAAGDVNFIYMNSLQHDRRSNAEVLVVSDEASCSYATYGWQHPLLTSALRKPQLGLVQMGAPNDQILLDDIALLPNPEQYKLIVFLNCYNMTTAQRALVDSLKGNGRTLLFMYAQGYFNINTASAANMQSVCGMNITIGNETKYAPRVYVKNDHPLGQAIISKGVTNFGNTSAIYRRFYVNDATTVRLGTDSGGTRRFMALKDMGTWQSIWSIGSEMPATVFREIARYAGVHIYNENNDAFYVNRAYVAIHPNHDEAAQQNRTITFPFAVDLYDAETETLLETNITSYTRMYGGGDTKVYRYVTAP